MQQINWGIIGCGSVTELKSGPAFGKVEGSGVVAVMRRNGEKSRDYAMRHNIPKYYNDADALIADPEVNAVYVATPPSSHARYAIRVMESGKPVYVEKPMAASTADCEAMQQVSESTGMPLYVAYYRRFLPYFHKVKEIISHGDLGRILFVEAMLHLPPRTEDLDPLNLPWRLNPSIAGAGYFYDLACHQIDLFEWFFGLAREVSGYRFNRAGLYGAEDVVFGNIVYESGVPLNATWCFATGHLMQKDIITVFGTQASLEFSTFGFTPIKVTKPEGVDEHLPPNPENIQYWLIRNMVEELQGKRQKTCNGESAVRTNRTMDIILGKSK